MSGRVIGADRLTKFFGALPEEVKQRVEKSMGRMVLKLQARVMRDKLSGQVLKVRTGTLRRSIDQVVYREDQAIRGVVSTNVEYARPHEYGFSGTVTVKEHLRLVKTAFGKDLKSPKEVMVRTHAARVNLPERSFLRSALKELQPEFFEEIEKAAGEVTK